MALSRAEINARSEAKRGIVTKSFKLPQQVSQDIDTLAEQLGLSKGKIIEKAIFLLQEQTKQL